MQSLLTRFWKETGYRLINSLKSILYNGFIISIKSINITIKTLNIVSTILFVFHIIFIHMQLTKYIVNRNYNTLIISHLGLCGRLFL